MDADVEPGVYTWLLSTDELYADAAVARLFGLDPEATLKGLPIEAYLARVYEADREKVARVISQAVKDGRPQNMEYRVISDDGPPHWVMSLGRCFKDHSGNPTSFAGIIYPLDQLQVITLIGSDALAN